MTRAEKLAKIAENSPKVYEAGQMSIIESKAYGSGTLTGCLDEPIFFLSFSFPNGAAKIVFTSESGETQEIIYSHSTGAVPGGVTFNDGKVIAEDSLGNVIDITNTSVGEQIKALRTYAGTTYVTSDYGVSVGYYKDVRQARYEEGEKVGKDSEKAKIDYNFKRSKKAVLMRGGEIDINAEIDALPEAIANIPIDASLAFYEDNEIAYTKIVPKGAEEYALLKQLGGMTYKCNNLIPFPYAQESNTTNGIEYTVNEDGSITANGTATATAYFLCIYTTSPKPIRAGKYILTGCPENGGGTTYDISISWRKNISDTRVFKYDYGTGAVVEIAEDGYYDIVIAVRANATVSNLLFKPMLNVGTTARPYEPYYEGLRDTKVTKIVSKGANLFDENAITHASNYKGTVLNNYGIVNKEGGYLEAKMATIIDTMYWQPFCEHLDVGTYTISADIYIPSGKAPTLNVVMGVRSANDTSAYFRGAGALSAYDNWERVSVQVSVQTEDSYFCVLQPSSPSAAEGSNLEVRFKNITIIRGTATEYTPYHEPISYPIPEAIQSLEGYGWGIDETNYNYCDFVNKKFIQKVGYDENGELIVLDEQIEQALSANFDNFLSVEGGGSLEFVNEHSNAVPSTVKYTTRVGN